MIFLVHLAKDNLVSSIRVAIVYFMEGILDKNEDGFCALWHLNKEVVDRFDYWRGNDDRGGLQRESMSNYSLHLLPSDPFGMNIITTFMEINGWLEDLEVDYGGYGTGDIGRSQGNYDLFTGLNVRRNNARRL